MAIKISLGPVQYYWGKEDLQHFYQWAAQSDIETVYLGETVCSKRRSFNWQDWLETAQALQAAGKEVILSTLTLLQAESELKTLRKICRNGQFMVEANDMAAVQLLTEQGLPFVGGASLNLYHSGSINKLARLGMRRWVIPLELGQDRIADILPKIDIETELFAWGRLPLAYSARCYTARAYDLPKDDCQYRCLDHEHGILLRTREGQPFLALNGIQTQSALSYDLLPELDNIQKLGIDYLRLSPQKQHMDKIVQAYQQALAGQPAPSLQAYALGGSCIGYWQGQAGIHRPNGKSS